MSKYALPISIIILSIALLYNGYQLGYVPSEKDAKPAGIQVNADKGLLTMEETAEYLSISEKQLGALVKVQAFEKSQLESFDTYRFIPYIEIDKEKLFNKNQVDEWIKYNSTIWEKWNGQ